MTIEEAKALLPQEMKYPLPDDVLMNLLDVCAIPFKFNFDGCENGLDYATLAAVIELMERRRGEDENDERRIQD